MAINSLSASSYGLSGLVSGMNTQDMVEKMLSGTKGKITAQQQKRAQLEYKQNLYRGLATQLRTLQNTFFSYSNPSTNLLSSAFFNKMTAETESKYFHASATTSAASGTVDVDYITQLAKAAKLTGGKKASSALRSETTNQSIEQAYEDFRDNLKASLKFTIDGPNGATTKELTADDLRGLAGLSTEDAAEALNVKLRDFGIKVTSANGKLTFATEGNNENLIISGDETGRALLGLSSATVSGPGSYTTKVDTKQLLPSIKISLDNGEAKSVFFDLKKYEDQYSSKKQALYHALEEGLNRTFGDAITLKMDATTGGEIEFGVKDPSRTFTITGSEEVMNILGMKSNSSNKMVTGSHLDEVNFATKLQGHDFRFSINGTDFHVTSDTTLNSLMTMINNSDAGVRMTYNENNDLFSLESTVSGSGSKIEIEQQEGNLMTALFGIEGSTSVSSKTMTNKNSVLEAANNVPLKSEGGRFSFDVIYADGVRRTINVNVAAPEKDGEYFTDKQAFIDAINEKLDENDDANKAGGIQLLLATDGTISLKAGDAGTTLIANAGKGSVAAELGFTNGQSNKLKKTDSIFEAGLVAAGGSFTIKGGARDASGNVVDAVLGDQNTLEDVRMALQNSLDSQLPSGSNAIVKWDENTSKFTIENVDTSAGDVTIDLGADAAKLFNDSVTTNGRLTFTEAVADNTVVKYTDGQNARVSIDGNEIERSNNNFTYNGVTFTLTQTFDKRQKDGHGNSIVADSNWVVDSEGFYRNNNNHYVLRDGTLADEDGNTYNADGTATGSTLADGWRDMRQERNGTEVYKYDERAGQVDVTRDTEQIYNGIVKFVDEYNKIMESIHSLLVEDPEYKNYLPLTEEQKAAMSDREIELWEEKAQTGLLRGDSALNSIWSDLRSTIYKKPSGSDIAIYNIGITTNGSTEWGGQLVIDHSKLLESISANPEGIRQMFTDATDGVATALNEAINRAAKNSTASPGRLVSLAGSSKSDTSSALYKQMKQIDDNLETLKDRYDSEYNRYWKQFNSMEQMIQQMNQQSSWLAQQFAT